MVTRHQLPDYPSDKSFDAAIVGGGISGASLYHTLCWLGHPRFRMDSGAFPAHPWRPLAGPPLRLAGRPIGVQSAGG